MSMISVDNNVLGESEILNIRKYLMVKESLCKYNGSYNAVDRLSM